MVTTGESAPPNAAPRLASEDDQRAQHDPSAWEPTLWRLVFRSRHVAMVALAAAAALIPAIGPDRAWVAAAVLLLVLPYDVVLDVAMRRTGRMPRPMAYTDQLVGVMFPLAEPSTWAPVMLVLLANVGLVTVAFGRTMAAKAATFGAAGLALVGFLVRPQDAIVGVIGFAIAAAMLVTMVGAVSEGERRLRQRYGALVEGLDAIVWEADAGTLDFSYVSSRAEEILGYPVDEWLKPGFWVDHLHPADRDRVVDHCLDTTSRGEDHELSYRMVAVDGRAVHLHDLVRVESDGAGRPARMRGVMVDVSDRERAQERVRQYADIVERIPMALVVLRLDDSTDDRSLRLVAANPEAALVTGRPLDELTGRLVDEAFPGLTGTDLIDRLAGVVHSGEAFDLDNAIVRPGNPTDRVYSLHAFPLPGDSVGVSLDDVTGPTHAAEALRRQALHDGLTGLPNRVLLNERIHSALRQASRSGKSVALLIMDLDQFKEVNDALGHHHGDRLLVAVSHRLETLLRDCDTVSRLGGDEFAVLMTTNASHSGAVIVAEKVTRALEQPFEIDGMSLQTNASIGIAFFPEHATDAQSLTQRADVAMYMAKRSGGGHAVYAAEHDRSSVRRLTLLGELRRALELDELRLHYQPSIDLRTGQVMRAEALVRWQHPMHGLMPPGEFIELAELSGLIQPLTRWVLHHAVRQARTWLEAGHEIGVAVNLSVRNLYDPELAPWLAALLARTRLPAHLLTLEITESEVMDDPLLAMEVLGQVSGMQVATSIDDFGTGYSSLSYLKHLPIGEIKIDRSFVAGMRTDENDATIVRSIIDLGHNLGLTVVAEGVEDAETLDRLAALGCDRAQGFHIGRPVPADEMLANLPGRAPSWERGSGRT